MFKKLCAVFTMLVLMSSSVVVFAFSDRDFADLNERGAFGQTLKSTVVQIGAQIDSGLGNDGAQTKNRIPQGEQVSAVMGGWVLAFGLTCFVMRMVRGRV